MKEIYPAPGDVVVTSFGAYQHYSLVSDRVCETGKPYLISATARTKTVKEEPWDQVTSGKKTYVVETQLSQAPALLLEHARQYVNCWRYSVTNNNCEHFINLITNGQATSSQVKSGVAGAAVGVGLVGVLSENPTPMKLLGAAVLCAGIAVVGSKAKPKRDLDMEA